MTDCRPRNERSAATQLPLCPDGETTKALFAPSLVISGQISARCVDAPSPDVFFIHWGSKVERKWAQAKRLAAVIYKPKSL